MKFKVFAVCLILIMLLSFSASAVKDDNYSLELDGFTVAKSGEDMGKISDVLNMSVSDVESFAKENGILFLAANADNTVQVRLSRHKTEFSTLANDMSALDDNGIEGLADSISDSDEKFTSVKSNGRKYIRTVSDLVDASGNYVSSRYFTVMDGYIYNFSVCASGENTKDAEKLFKGLKLYSSNGDSSAFAWWTVAFAATVAVFTAAFAVALVGIIKTAKKKDEKETEDIEKNA